MSDDLVQRPGASMGAIKAWQMEQSIAYCGLEAYAERLHECVNPVPKSDGEAVRDAQAAVSEAARVAAQRLSTDAGTPRTSALEEPRASLRAVPKRRP